MQLGLFNSLRVRRPRSPATLAVGSHSVSFVFVRNARARRYILRIDPTGAVRVTLPARGSQAEAWNFVRRKTAWIKERIEQHLARPQHPAIWGHGTQLLYRGDLVQLAIRTIASGQTVEFADQRIDVALEANVRSAVERHLWILARRELETRTAQLATQHGLTVSRITVRNQRSRWGSCSRRGTISLNWRLIQAPAYVQDYIILHELMHLREHNHSSRFWRQVETVCPDYEVAEKWLKQHRQESSAKIVITTRTLYWEAMIGSESLPVRTLDLASFNRLQAYDLFRNVFKKSPPRQKTAIALTRPKTRKSCPHSREKYLDLTPRIIELPINLHFPPCGILNEQKSNAAIRAAIR